MSMTFGNSLERPCVDCGGHPLRAVHDRNGAGFTHYYVPPAKHEQPVLEGEERGVRKQGLIATAGLIKADREAERRADRFDDLVKALQFQRDALNDLCDEGLSLPPSIHAKLANMRDDADVALNAVAKERER